MLKLVVLLGLSLAVNALDIPATDNRIYHTEHNWYTDPAGFLETINSGAYLKVRFNGSSFRLNLDDSFNQVNCTLAWSVDDGPEQSIFMPVTSNSITIASNLNKDAIHSLYLFVKNQLSPDCWYNPITRLRIMNVTIDDDATLFAPKLASKRLLVYGDSITEGTNINGMLPKQLANDAHLTWAFALALALDAELSVVAFGGQGYTKAGAGNSPQLWNSSGLSHESAWKWLSVDHDRTFATCPDYILNEHGGNDYDQDQNQVYINSLGWLRDMRKVCPQSHIFFTIPFGQFCEATLVKVYQDYQTGNPDPLTHLIQMGEQVSAGLRSRKPTFECADGVHPRAWKSSQIGAVLAVKIVSLLNKGYTIMEM